MQTISIGHGYGRQRLAVWVFSLWLGALLGAGCDRQGPGAAEAGAGAGSAAEAVVAQMNRGVSMMGQYQYGEAAEAFRAALEAEPGLAGAKVNLAIALFNRNEKEDHDLETASRLLDEVLAVEPEHLRAIYFRGIILQHVGKAEEAIDCFERVVRARPADGAAWYLLGLCKERLGAPAEAELLKALEFRPYLFSAYYKLFQIASREEREVEAKEYLEQFKALRESPLGEAIELPQYHQMGELALVQPLSAQGATGIARSRYQLGEARVVARFTPGADRAGASREPLGGMAAGDVNGDGRADLVVVRGGTGGGPVALLLGTENGLFTDGTAAGGLGGVAPALAAAVGDYDNDGIPDLFIARTVSNQLFRGLGEGRFADVTAASGIGGSGAVRRAGIFLDADHDADLDIFVCRTTDAAGAPVGNELWNNNGDGTFTNLASGAPVACGDGRSILVLPGDLDDDRDVDLVLLGEGEPARVFVNDLLGQFSLAPGGGSPMRGDRGGVLQDFNGDGLADLMVLGGDPPALRLFLGNGRGGFEPSATFGETTDAIASWGPLRAFRAGDVDWDGDLDVVVFGGEAHGLLNDGRGRFVLQDSIWAPPEGAELAAVELGDLNGDRVVDLAVLVGGEGEAVLLIPGKVTPPLTATGLQPTGMRGRDKRTRSPASGYGAALVARAGLREQRLIYTGLNGGPSQSWLPVVFGLGGAAQADYVQILWPDGVAQVEMALAAGQTQVVGEVQRKLSSCPVLFAWNGFRFGFVTDFAGVGGLGYFAAPGECAPPQVLEHVKIEPEQLQARAGRYELRVTEPMEEVAYVDRLELLAVDHPASAAVFPDERLAIHGPAPTRELLVVNERIFPRTARGPAGGDCVDRLARVDRQYAYPPALDRRYLGFCEPHALELEFGDELSAIPPGARVFLFIHGYIEYPYSQTVYAASQSRIGWEPIRVEQFDAEGQWEVIIPDGGAPGGMARMMTIDLTGRLAPGARRLRLVTNLEIYYDQVFVAVPGDAGQAVVRTVPLVAADLRRVGFPREYTPDGREPLIYDYELRDATAPFHVLRGAYTRYGPVMELLGAFDDRHVLVGPGDEIALQFDAATLPEPAAGVIRSYILVSHSYCKDMDLYTATPQTLEPLPFRAMSRYPYASPERYPDGPEHQAYRRAYNTRVLE